MLVILLNFLIAQVSQSYDCIIGEEVQYVYMMKADLNFEIMPFVDSFYREKTSAQGSIFYIRAPRENVSFTEEYAGFVKTVKKAITVS